MRDNIDAFLTFTSVFFTGIFFGILLTAQYVPKLRGYGCENSHGVIYADEEDYFPRCKAIVENN